MVSLPAPAEKMVNAPEERWPGADRTKRHKYAVASQSPIKANAGEDA
jgi:hypothetical protein